MVGFCTFMVAICSFLALGPAPAAEPTTPYQLADEAARLYKARNWEQASVIYQQVVTGNPDSGNRWNEYAHALYNLKRYDEAITAFQRAIDLGVATQTSAYNIACCHALSGRDGEALAWLRKAMDFGFREDETLQQDADLDELRSDPRFQEITGLKPWDALTRDDRWRYDLDYLLRRGEQIHYSLYARTSRESLHAAVDQLKARVGELEDHEIVVGIMKILAMVGDGHTVVVGYDDGRDAVRTFPIQFHSFDDGIYVLAAREEHRSIVGGKLLRVGNMPVEEAVRAVRPYCSVDNEMGVLSWTTFLLRVPEVLHTLRMTAHPHLAEFAIEAPNGGGMTTVQLTAENAPDLSGAALASDFVYLHQIAGEEPALYLRHLDRYHWFEHLPEHRLVYAAFNVVRDAPAETVAGFADRLFTFINEQGVEYLVLDLRHNGGGNNMLNRALVHALIKCERINRIGRLFVVTSRRTFSAAMNAAVDIERNTAAIFVGEPTGSSPNFVGETGRLRLPCSGLKVSLSALYWQNSLPYDRRTWIAPAIPARPTVDDIRSNRDPAMDAILKEIGFAQANSQVSSPAGGR